MTHEPHNWVILKFVNEPLGKIWYKVLAGWRGGFADGDSWKLNSGITKVTEHEKYYSVDGYSGSVYELYKDYEGLSMMTSSIYNQLVELSSKENVTIEIVKIESILEEFKDE